MDQELDVTEIYYQEFFLPMNRKVDYLFYVVSIGIICKCLYLHDVKGAWNMSVIYRAGHRTRRLLDTLLATRGEK